MTERMEEIKKRASWGPCDLAGYERAHGDVAFLLSRCASLEEEIKEYEEGYSEIACALGDESGGNHDSIMEDIAATQERIASLEALVRELAKTLYAAEDRLIDVDGRETEEGRNILSAISAALSHPLVSELTGEKECGEC